MLSKIPPFLDFGLTSFRRLPQLEKAAQKESAENELLWTAPEFLLGATNLDSVGRGSISGDVYSFVFLRLSMFISACITF